MIGPCASRAAQMVKGLASLLMLAVLTGGPPAALYKMSGSPVPHTLPSWHQVVATLMRRDDGTLFLATVRYVTWLAWVAFVISVVVEAVSRARGRPAPHLPVLAPAQTFAAALIGAAVLSLLPVPQLRAAPPQIPRASQAAAAAPPRPGQQAPTASGLAAQRQQALPSWALPAAAAAPPADPRGSSMQPAHHRQERTHTVVGGDDLWDIAVHYLGDGERWHEIYGLNRGRPQPGGGQLSDPDLIYPGWILVLPARSTGPAPPAAPPRPPAHRPPPASPAHRPTPHSGEPGRQQASPGLTTPSGHASTHPPQHRGPSRQRTRPVTIHLPGGGLTGITFAAAISAALVAWRLHRRRVATARWPIPDGPFEPPLPETIQTLRRAHLNSLAADAADAHGQPWPGDDAAAGGDIDGDGALDEFGAPAGPPATAEAGPLPTDPAQASRRGGVTTTADGGAAPAILSAPVAPPAQAQAPPTATPGGAAGSALSWRPAPPPAQPLPAGTVTFGVRGNSEIPLGAVAHSGLGLTGPGAAGVARALLIAVLAAAEPGGQHPPQVIIPDGDVRQLTGDQQAARIAGVDPGPPAGLTITPTLIEALSEIETEITRRLRALDASAGDNGLATPLGGQPTMAPLALIAHPDQASGRRLQAVLHAGASTGVVGILLGDWPAGTTCRIGPGGTVTAASDPGLTGAQAYHLASGDAAAMLSLLRGAGGHVHDDRPGTPGPTPPEQPAAASSPPAAPPVRPRQPVPDGEPTQADRRAARPQTPVPAAGEPAAPDAGPDPPVRQPGQPEPTAPAVPGGPPQPARPVRISVLGPLRITAAGTEIQGGLRKARELLAYLAVHPDGVSGEAISHALWPDAGPRYATAQRNLALRKAREMLRTATGLDGPMFILLSGGRYRLDPSLIDADLWRFTAALADAQAAATGEDQLTALRRATTLYQGPPADGGYDWAERDAEPARRQALDAQARIAAILADRDPEQALAALETALTHDPYNEAVYQQIMDLQAQLGRPDAVRRTLRLLETRLAELGQSPGPAARQKTASATGNPPSRLTRPHRG